MPWNPRADWDQNTNSFPGSPGGLMNQQIVTPAEMNNIDNTSGSTERSSEGGNRGASGAGYAPELDPMSGNQSALPSWLQQPGQGSKLGLQMAPYAGYAGTAVGLGLGVPGLGTAAKYLANKYLNNNVFQSDGDQGDWWEGEGDNPGPVEGPMSEFNRSVNNANPNTWGAQQNKIPMRGVYGHTVGLTNQRGNSQAGMRTDFRTQFDWAHGSSADGTTKALLKAMKVKKDTSSE